MSKHAAALLTLSLLVAGCDSPTDAPAPKTDEPQTKLFDSQTQALEKAKQLEGQLQEDAAERNQQIDDATK